MIGYARFWTIGQTLEQQTEALTAAGARKIFHDVMSGARDDRPGFAECMRYLREGDTLIVWRLDRLGRNMRSIVNTLHQLTLDAVERGRPPVPVDRKRLVIVVSTRIADSHLATPLGPARDEFAARCTEKHGLQRLGTPLARLPDVGGPSLTVWQRSRMLEDVFSGAGGEMTAAEWARRVVNLAVWAYAVWILLTGTPTAESLAVGAGVALACGVAFAPVGRVAAPWTALRPHRIGPLARLAATCAVRIVRANLSLSRRILLPSRPLRSGMIIVPRQHLMANSPPQGC